MIKRIGTKIYYCLVTGNVIKIIGDMQGYVRETTFDDDYEIYTELKERDRETIGLLQFEYGEYPKLSKDSTGVMVDLENKELIFSYEELPQEPIEPTWKEQMENKISILSEQNDQQEEIIASLTYELMMLQEPTASSTLINNHSPKYNLIKSWFNKGYWNEEMLLNAVEKHYITEEEMNEIIG